MDAAAEFANIQMALMIAFGPFAMWLLVILAATGILGGIFAIWMAMLRRLTAGR